MIEDAELLRRYASDRSEAAFAELVRRRVNLVYSVALRQVGGDAHLAHDVTQSVFADLARKAPMLAERAVLSGWLCRSAQFAASDVVRRERRRRSREQESQIMHETVWMPAENIDWDKVRPMLDEALGELGEVDRDAIALRFFEERPFAEIGARLRLTEEAARKRVERALDKLAAALSRHGVTSTTAALGVALATHASIAAPAGVVSSVVTTSLAAGSAAAAPGVAWALWSWPVAGKVAVGILGVGATVATGAAWVEARAKRANEAALVAANQQQASLHAQVRALQSDVAVAQQRALAAEDDNAKLLAAIERARLASAAGGGVGELDLAARETIETRYKRAQDFVRERKWDLALGELLWCYDDGMKQHSSYSGMRLSVLLADIAKVAVSYPPALAALRERRDRAQLRVAADSADESAALEFSSLNRALGEDARTLELYDRLATDDPQRRRLRIAGAFQLLVNARRYADALQAVPYERILLWWERESRPPNVANEAYPELALKRHRRTLVTDAARSVEVLAGAGDLPRAREFAGRLLAFDGSEETIELLQKHVTRAGHSGLLRSMTTAH